MTEYMTLEQHKDHCDGMKRWADSVIKSSEEDRGKLWDTTQKIDKEVKELAHLVTRFQWWFIGILVAIIISSYIMPKITQNGTHVALEKLSTQVQIIADKQLAIDSIINEVRGDQIRRQGKETR